MIDLGQAWVGIVLAYFAFIFWPRAIEENQTIVQRGDYIDTREVTL